MSPLREVHRPDPSLTPNGRLVIELAAPGEYEAIDRLILDAYSHDYGPSESYDAMRFARTRAERFDVWVARDASGELLGSVTTRRQGGPSLHEDVADDELDLRLLGVSPAARRRGVGAAIMGRVAEHALEQGFSAVYLKTAPNMGGAHRLYDSLGFVRTPERDGLWIGGERVLDLFSYVYPLTAPAVAAGSVDAGVPGAPVTTASPIATFDTAQHRSVLGSFASGVVVLAAGDAAVTVQSFFSLSLDPPLVALSIGRSSSSWPAIAASGSFAVTVLADDQAELARRISRRGQRKLEGVPTVASPRSGQPILIEGVAWLECEVRNVHDGGDHLLVVAHVRDLGHLDASCGPLLFANSRFGRLASAEG